MYAARSPLSSGTASLRASFPLPAILLSLLLLLGSLAAGRHSQDRSAVRASRLQAGYAALPLSFEPNRGQMPGNADFLARGAGYSLFLQAGAATFAFPFGTPGAGNSGGEAPQRQTSAESLRMEVVGANVLARSGGVERLPGQVNYLRGSDPQKWLRHLPTYGKVRYQKVYPGIDLLYYGNGQQLEYDFVIAPHRSSAPIRLRFTGQQGHALPMSLNARGDLVLRTAAGELLQHRPVAYQEAGGRRLPVAAEYVLAGEEVRFRLGVHDPAQPLVIDPVLEYSTYLTGKKASWFNDVAVDAEGCAYVTGVAATGDPLVGPYITTDGAFDETHNGRTDAVVSKLSADGTRLLYSTYLGWGATAQAIAVNARGEAGVTGVTGNPDFPQKHPVPRDPEWDGRGEAFVLKLNADGSDLVFSTFLGGYITLHPPESPVKDRWNSVADWGVDIAMDADGNTFVSGLTTSGKFPVSENALQKTLRGRSDAFLTQLLPDGTLSFSTFLGGGAEEGPTALALGHDGTVYLTGHTDSRDFPTTQGAFRRTLPADAGDWHAFAMKLDPRTPALLYSTYVGGIELRDFDYNTEFSQNRSFPFEPAIGVDAAGNAYLVGYAHDWSYPTTPGAFDRNPDGLGFVKTFVTKLDPTGSRLVYSTYIGVGEPGGMTVDVEGSVYLTGRAYQGQIQFPVTERPFGPRAQAFVTKLHPDGASLDYSFLIGGSSDTYVDIDVGEGIALGPEGSVYLAGWTRKIDFPTTPNALQPEPIAEFGLIHDMTMLGWVAKFRTVVPAPPTELVARALSSTQIRLTWTDPSPDETGFSIYRKGEDGGFFPVGRVSANVTNFTDSGLRPETTYTYVVRASGKDGPSLPSNEASATTLPTPPAAPTNLAVTVLSSTALKLTWRDRSTNETAFRLERRLEGGTFARLTDTGANATSYTDERLNPNTRYIYRLKARNLGGESAYSNEAAGLTLPAAPTSLRAAAVGKAQEIALTWSQESTGAEGFLLERRQGTAAFAPLAEVGATSRSYTDRSVSRDVLYTYRVRARNASGNSLPSNEASASVLPTPPAAPTDLKAAALSSSALKLTWQDRSSNEVSFRLERRQGTAAFARLADPGPGTTNYTDNGLRANSRYEYRLLARNPGGDSAYSNLASGLTLPAAPTALRATVGGSRQVTLSWSQESTGADRFRIERRQGSGGFSRLDEVAGTLRTYVDRTASPTTAYRYQVKAVNASGESLPSPEAAATTPPDPPAAPSELQVTPLSISFLRLTWRDNSLTERGFYLERQSGASGFLRRVELLPNVTRFADTGLEPNTRYRYRLKAWNAGGESAYSAEAPGLTLPVAPALRAALAGTQEATLTWEQDPSGADGFRLERQEGSGLFRPLTEVGGTLRSYQDRNLTPNVAYTYRVRAFNASGHSDYSNSAAVTTPRQLGGVLVVTPAKVNFGKVKVKKTKLATVTLRNASATERLQVTVTPPAAPFRLPVPVGTVELEPGATRAVSVSFRPTRKKKYSGRLSLTSSDPARLTASVGLKGEGK